MSEEVISGHDGMEVLRTERGILKRATTRHSWDALRNEHGILRHLSGSGLAPEPIEIDEEDWTILQEDLGESMVPGGEHAPHPDFDPEKIRHSMIRWLYRLRFPYNMRHGDLTGINVIIRDNEWIGIDWQESHALTEKAPQKQPWSDGWLAMRTFTDLELDRNRIARRWQAVLGVLKADNFRKTKPLPLKDMTFIDFGCYEGDFPALAATEGMQAYGIDSGAFRQEYDSIEGARDLWGEFRRLTFVKEDVFDLDLDSFPTPTVAMCCSTWPYLVRGGGRERSERWIADVIRRSSILFFETQYEGDGPGIDTEDSIREMFDRLGAHATPIGTFPVAGRPAERTLWEVREA